MGEVLNNLQAQAIGRNANEVPGPHVLLHVFLCRLARQLNLRGRDIAVVKQDEDDFSAAIAFVNILQTRGHGLAGLVAHSIETHNLLLLAVLIDLEVFLLEVKDRGALLVLSDDLDGHEVNVDAKRTALWSGRKLSRREQPPCRQAGRYSQRQHPNLHLTPKHLSHDALLKIRVCTFQNTLSESSRESTTCTHGTS